MRDDFEGEPWRILARAEIGAPRLAPQHHSPIRDARTCSCSGVGYIRMIQIQIMAAIMSLIKKHHMQHICTHIFEYIRVAELGQGV